MLEHEPKFRGSEKSRRVITISDYDSKKDDKALLESQRSLAHTHEKKKIPWGDTFYMRKPRKPR